MMVALFDLESAGTAALQASAPGALDLSAIPRTVLVVGGTGMLAPAVRTLLNVGRTVVLVARHASRFEHPAGDLVAVDSDWSDPETLAEATRQATSDRDVGAALLWVHLPHRDPVTAALDSALPRDATFVRLWGTGSGYPRDDARAAIRLEARIVREAYLGSVAEPRGWRWLTHEEISTGALEALAGDAREHVIGELGRR